MENKELALVEMGKTHPEWAKKYETIAQLSEKQVSELRSSFRNTLMMRYETSEIGLLYLKITKQLQKTKDLLDELEQIDFVPQNLNK